MVIAIFGGSQKATFKSIGKKHGVDVLFHAGGNNRSKTKREYRPLVKKSDCVVVMLGAVSHACMHKVKDLCKKYDKEIIFHKGFGASGAIKTCVNHLNNAV